MYNLIEWSDNYSKTPRNLQQYWKVEPAINDANGELVDFNIANAINNLFKLQQKITGKTGNNGGENVDIIVSLKYLSKILKNP